MHKVKHEYVCDQCGDMKESSGTLPNWLRLSLIEDPRGSSLGHWDFCSKDCKDDWLVSHNFEVWE